eukprot:GHVH01008212.1.p1 GENE.GHVH01008212.1~~GHVH01008212.1.p1  ORF type:complete len:186 (+),score=21.05 GHVH01008212.1:53-559(+)
MTTGLTISQNAFSRSVIHAIKHPKNVPLGETILGAYFAKNDNLTEIFDCCPLVHSRLLCPTTSVVAMMIQGICDKKSYTLVGLYLIQGSTVSAPLDDMVEALNTAWKDKSPSFGVYELSLEKMEARIGILSVHSKYTKFNSRDINIPEAVLDAFENTFVECKGRIEEL